MGVGKSGDGEWMGVGWNWKTGMISDCDELQENQRKNGPLTVKTPSPPCTGSPPAWRMQGGVWLAHFLRLILRRRRSLPPALPLSRLPLRGRSQAGRKAPQSLARQRLRANAEKVQKPAFTAAKVGQDQAGIMGRIKRRAAKFPPVEVGEVGEGVARGSPGAVLLPSCPAPAMHPNAQQGQPLPACQAGRRAKAGISVSVQKTPVKD